MTRKLTELTLQRVTAPKTGRLELADAQLPGLSCRVTRDGTRTFALRYRVDGRQRRLTVGRYPIVGLGEARSRARDALALVERGVDPAAVKAEAKAKRERDSVEAVIGQYVERHLRRNTKTARAVEQMLRRNLNPWTDRPIRSIGRRDVLDLLDGIVDRGSPVTANRVLSLTKRLFSWAIERGIVDASPADKVKPPHKEKPRQRSLDEAELRAAWGAFETLGYPFGAVGMLLALTGQRRGEVAGLRWDQIDLERGILRLEATDTKTEVEHVLSLPLAAVKILRNIPRIDASPLVFPASKIGSANPVSGFSKALLSAHRLSGTSAWTWHDIRRTCATGMARLNVPPHVVERILNHSGGSTMSVVARTYNTYRYEPEMRRALELWGAEVERIVNGAPAKVVALPRR